MQVSTNNYQMLNTYQQPVIQPIVPEGPSIQPVPQEPKYSSKDIYEASHGNLIIGEDGNLALTPQGETNLNNAISDKKDITEAQDQAQKDATRSFVTDYLDASSKKSQVEIYLSTATDGKYDGSDDTIEVISNLRDIQKQNNAVEAYATYKEFQQAIEPYNIG
jgi:hypothetical protein